MSAADDLLAFIDAAPTPYHAVAEAAARLTAAGFTELDPTRSWSHEAAAFVRTGGALVAWVSPPGDPADPFRFIGAHTDSPNLRLRPHTDVARFGFSQLDVEVYGGTLLNSWLDRDLGLSGRVVIDHDGALETRLFRDDRPLLRIPQLAIHLDRDVNEKGLVLNRQTHLTPVWGLNPEPVGGFVGWLAATVGTDPDRVRAWDAMVHPIEGARRLGPAGDLISAPRLDNLCSCFGAVEALIAATGATAAPVAAIALFDHEEVGSESATGAAGSLLATVVERIVAARGGDRDAVARALAGSRFLSADMAHGVHPNYPERHEPLHQVRLGGGPVIKVNVGQRYATDAVTQADFESACRRAGVDVQHYSHRGDLACGSTIGPIVAARLGVPTVDAGMAQLSMHSSRELMATDDVAVMVAAFGEWLSPTA